MESTYDKIQYYELEPKEKDKLIAKLKGILAKEERIKLAVLFGSATRRSYFRDIDVAIQASPELSFREFLNLNAQIELEVGVPVDLVDLANLAEPFKTSILKSGRLLKGKTRKTSAQP